MASAPSSAHDRRVDDAWTPRRQAGPHVTIDSADAAGIVGSSLAADLGARRTDARRVRLTIFSGLLLTCGTVGLYDLYLLAASLVGT